MLNTDKTQIIASQSFIWQVMVQMIAVKCTSHTKGECFSEKKMNWAVGISIVHTKGTLSFSADLSSSFV